MEIKGAVGQTFFYFKASLIYIVSIFLAFCQTQCPRYFKIVMNRNQ